jgi:hypothetical protein
VSSSEAVSKRFRDGLKGELWRASFPSGLSGNISFNASTISRGDNNSRPGCRATRYSARNGSAHAFWQQGTNPNHLDAAADPLHRG